VQQLIGRAALVTGSARSGSIGREIALEMAREGADIAINDLEQRREEAEEVCGEIQALGRQACVVLADVTRVSECKRIVNDTVDRLGRLDILVNNAGGGKWTAFQDVTEEDWDHQLAINLKAPFFLSQAAAPFLKSGHLGRIINIATELSYNGLPQQTHYTAAKAGLRTLTKSLALALAPDVTVNTVSPGPTLTQRLQASPEFTLENRDRIPLKRWGTPHDIARSVVFLVSSDGDAYTGQTLDPNGGTVMP